MQVLASSSWTTGHTPSIRWTATPTVGTRRLFETRRLLTWQPDIPRASKRDRRLFEAGFYLSKYGSYNIIVMAIFFLPNVLLYRMWGTQLPDKSNYCFKGCQYTFMFKVLFCSKPIFTIATIKFMYRVSCKIHSLLCMFHSVQTKIEIPVYMAPVFRTKLPRHNQQNMRKWLLWHG